MNDVPLIPRRILFGNPEKASPRLSPDGKLLAYLAPDDGVLNVWVRTLGSSDGRVVTNDRLRGIRSYFWQPDSKHILYVQDVGGNENFHLYQTDVATRETKNLTPFEGARAQIVAVDPAFPDKMLVSLNQRNPELFDVYRLHFDTGEMELDTENPGDVGGWTADNALQVRAAEAMLPGGWQEIRIRPDAQSPWRSFQRWGPEDATGGVAGFSPDNRSLWLISSVDANTTRLLDVDLTSGDSRIIAEDSHYDVGGTMEHPRTHELQAVSFVRAKTEWQIVDESIGPDFEALARVHDSEFSVVSRDLNDRVWIVAYVSDDVSPAHYVYRRDTKTAEFLFAAYPELAGYTLAAMQPVELKARDGLMLQGYLTMPVGVSKKAPMVLLVHGGPWVRDMWGYHPLVQMLANRGYGVLQINYRGSTGYGKAHLNAGDREWGAKMHDDLLDTKKWAIDNGYADPGRFCIMGGSYGGYAVLAALAFTPSEFSCGVDIVGPSNLLTLLRTIPPYWAPMKAMFDKRVGNIDTEEEFLKARSPLFQSEQISVPLLIGQGANDPRVKKAESDQIVHAMRANGKPVEYIVFADEGHGFARPENSMRFWAATEDFLAKYMGGRAEPPSAEEDWQPFME
jgi:dipeptidyl aminopeptidase/acylaminoacyl peptidase